MLQRLITGSGDMLFACVAAPTELNGISISVNIYDEHTGPQTLDTLQAQARSVDTQLVAATRPGSIDPAACWRHHRTRHCGRLRCVCPHSAADVATQESRGLNFTLESSLRRLDRHPMSDGQ
jgi:hypothetical protein